MNPHTTMAKLITKKPLTPAALDLLFDLLCAPSSLSASKAPDRMTRADFPSDWKVRRVEIHGYALALQVPCYVVRIDIDKPGMAGTHGWQVRYRKDTYGSRFFSDSRFDRKGHLGTPKESLYAAKLYLAAIWAGEPVRPLPAEYADKQHPTGMTGVRVVWRERRGRMQCYVRVSDLAGKQLANLYVGVKSTVTASRLEAKVEEARRQRRAYLKSIGQLARLPKQAATRGPQLFNFTQH